MFFTLNLFRIQCSGPGADLRKRKWTIETKEIVRRSIMQFLCGTANSFTRLHAVQRSAPECFIAAGVVFALRSSLCVDSSSIYESQFSDFLLHARRVVPAKVHKAMLLR